MSDETKIREILSKAYSNAGKEFLAYRLTKVLARLEKAEDVALHNDVMTELDMMVLPEHTGELLKDIADKILMYSMKGIK